MKVIVNIAALIVVMSAAYCVQIVVYAPAKRLYPKILAMHTNPASRPKEHGQLPCLYVSQFYQNSLDGGKDYALYNNGLVIIRRITRYGAQGGNGPTQDQQQLQAFEHITSLPPGISDPDTIPHNDLLIVSLHHGTWWKTYYYDRRNLPMQVQPVAQIADVSVS